MGVSFKNAKSINETIVTIGNEKLINVEETIKFEIGKGESTSITIPLPFYKKLLRDPQITLDGVLIGNYGYGGWIGADYSKGEIGYKDGGNFIRVSNLNNLSEGEHTIVINCEYYNTDIVEYNDMTVLRLNENIEHKEYNIKFVLPRETSIFKINNKDVICEEIEENVYMVNLSNAKGKDEYLELIMDKGAIDGVTYVNEEYQNVKNAEIKLENTEKYENFDETFKIIIFVVGIEIICMVALMIIYKKNKVEKEYIRECENVINPILAEAIIDRKIGAKELVMSCIANLINKGNLECKNNDKIKLLNCENVTNYERRIIDSLFKYLEDTITFEEIKNMFKSRNDKTLEFFNMFKQIKNDIENELFNKNIYDKTGEILLKVIRVISIMLFANILLVIYSITMHYGYIMPYNMLWFNIFAIIIAILKEKIGNKLNQKMWSLVNDLKKNISFKPIKYILIFSIFLSMVSIILYSKKYIEIYIISLVSLIINIILFKKAHTHIFTKEGKQEYKKAYGLKAYIEDYSLMKERELESTILWDDYLTYAIAFGISNKVTDRFGEGFMKTNVALQNIDKFLRF